jgi:hypothetical protein
MSAAPQTSPRIAIATCRDMPGLDADGPLLRAALAEAGTQVEVCVWDDPTVGWGRYELVLIRSTWDYVPRRQQFLDWAARCRRTANPAEVLVWNTDKRYLQTLRNAGVPTVPTVFVAPGEPFKVPAEWVSGDIVVKPTVSAGSADTGRFPGGATDGEELARQLHSQGRTAMVQPYLKRVEDRGETALIYLGGAFSHSIRKAALLTGLGTREPVVGDDAPDSITSNTACVEELAVAQSALAAVPGGSAQLSYARVDVMPDATGQPVLLELELTEPSLFLAHAPDHALRRFAETVAARCRP